MAYHVLIAQNADTCRFLNVLFQLSMVTLLCLMFMLLQIKGTSSPLNVIIKYSQLCAIGLKIGGGIHSRLMCYFGQASMTITLTVVDVLNLEFFLHCSVSVLPLMQSTFFSLIIYPLVFTAFVYISIELYDRNFKLFLVLSYPIRCLRIFILLGTPGEQFSIPLSLFSCFHIPDFYLYPSTFSSLLNHTTVEVKVFPTQLCYCMILLSRSFTLNIFLILSLQ